MIYEDREKYHQHDRIDQEHESYLPEEPSGRYEHAAYTVMVVLSKRLIKACADY